MIEGEKTVDAAAEKRLTSLFRHTTFEVQHWNMNTTYETGPTGLHHITRREIDILSLMAQGLINKEIGWKLNISPETVKKHVKNIYRKTGSHNKIDALNKTKWLMSLFANSN